MSRLYLTHHQHDPASATNTRNTHTRASFPQPSHTASSACEATPAQVSASCLSTCLIMIIFLVAATPGRLDPRNVRPMA